MSKRFNSHASDSQLLTVLRGFITGEYVGLIDICNVDRRPWTLFSRRDDTKGGYFFCHRQRKPDNSGKRFLRRSAAWHGTDKGKVIFDEQGKHTSGVKKKFVFKNRDEPKHDGLWLLQEYCLAEHVIAQLHSQDKLVPERKDIVLCHLKRKRTHRQPCDRINRGDQMESEGGFVDIKIRDDDDLPVDRIKRTNNIGQDDEMEFEAAS